eukprot:CAMPEP_0114593236 /NCGR_PEP_ID=MMETSP0125-20121206/14862_1 /TAXON_ID=485358 ORGANISM="Aristerostoma sp., Strain ATCC 50986" /NCGR_SAMPLE_ID=MMETSP0125 /ASSEMBLY_ACC=CAM_ASM_000245 /LENGTH=49 /DNA_ID=CAMNT_0001792277 /DNA_START=981 /DNA_END=1130 /DNA_ORIENTATION=-
MNQYDTFLFSKKDDNDMSSLLYIDTVSSSMNDFGDQNEEEDSEGSPGSF